MLPDDRSGLIETRDLPEDHLATDLLHDLARSGRAALSETYDEVDTLPASQASQLAAGIADMAALVSRAEADLAEHQAHVRAEHARRGTLAYWLERQRYYDDRFPWLAEHRAQRSLTAAERLAAEDVATAERRTRHLTRLDRLKAHGDKVRSRYPRPEVTP